MKNFRNQIFIPVAAAMVLFFAVPVYSYPKPLDPQSDASVATQRQGDAYERLGDAYENGYVHGQADAQAGSPRNGQPSGNQWTTDEAHRAYRKGYDAGYQSAPSSTPSAAVPSPGANRYGYNDGLAVGRKDHDGGHSFKPTDSEMYKKADHGWSADFGDKEHYRQLYRQAYSQGYQDGYGTETAR
jgi:hypothetical protein